MSTLKKEDSDMSAEETDEKENSNMPPEQIDEKAEITEANITVKVEVGTQPFYVNLKALCAASEIFEPLHIDLSESIQSWEFELDEKPKDFAVFKAWLETGEIEVIGLPSCYPLYHLTDRQIKDRFRSIIDAIVFANFIKAFGFQNALMDELVITAREAHEIRRWVNLPGTTPDSVDDIYERCGPGHPLRQYVIDAFLSQPKTNRIFEDIEDFIEDCAKFTADILGVFLAPGGRSSSGGRGVQNLEPYSGGFPWEQNICRYHQHPDQPKGYKCSPYTSAEFMIIEREMIEKEIKENRLRVEKWDSEEREEAESAGV